MREFSTKSNSGIENCKATETRSFNSGNEIKSKTVEISENNSFETDKIRSADIVENEHVKNLEHAQESVEKYHREAIDRILEKNGKYFSETDRQRIEKGVDQIEAVKNDPDSGHTGLYSAGNHRIEVVAVSEAQMERSTIHETNHFASYHSENIVPIPCTEKYIMTDSVGFRTSSWIYNAETHTSSELQTKGRGLNEGVTTLFTNEQLYSISEEKGLAAEREGIYCRSTELCKQLESIVGKDVIAESYYGGSDALEKEIDSLGGRGTFEAFRESLDKTISTDYNERIQGTKEAQSMLAGLYDKKYGAN